MRAVNVTNMKFNLFFFQNQWVLTNIKSKIIQPNGSTDSS